MWEKITSLFGDDNPTPSPTKSSTPTAEQSRVNSESSTQEQPAKPEGAETQ
jgi:hypothetical protein